MKIMIRRVDKDLPLPKYHSPGAVAFDLVSRKDLDIPAQSIARIPTNIVVVVPEGFVLMLRDRGSTATKGLMATAGVIDQDYHGDQDEILFQVYNFTNQTVSVKRGDRLGQAMFVRIEKAEWEEIEKTDKPNRGGFGSTGQR